jgi:putative transcriptional regulator
MRLREELLLLRKRRGLTQEQVATAVGIDRTAYCRIERGNRRPPVDVAIRIAEVLGVKVEDIFMPADVYVMHTAAPLEPTGTEEGRRG